MNIVCLFGNIYTYQAVIFCISKGCTLIDCEKKEKNEKNKHQQDIVAVHKILY